jgi:rfaE bifunctional protein kinase chain/domain
MINEQRFESVLKGFKNVDPILVVGDVGVDKYTYGEVNRISPEAPVPVLEVNKEWMKLGLAANVVDNLQSLEVKSTICGVIGDDTNANLLENLLEENQLSTWGIIRDKSRMTTFKERVVTEIQQVCRVDYETKHAIDNEVYGRLKDRFDEFKVNHSAIVIEDYGKGLIRKNVAEYIISESNNLGKTVAVDPSRTTPPTFYTGATLLKPNKVEAMMMAEHLGYGKKQDVEEVANILVDKLKLEKIIITLGAEGMGLIDTKNGGEFIRIPTVANEVFDVSGAGDTSISAIITSLACGATLEEAAWIGNCAAGVVVAKKGTALVSQGELIQYYDKLKHSNIE